jgi:hypothetical protein
VNLLAYLFQMGMPAILYGLGRDLWDTLLWGAWLLGVSLAGWHVQRTPRLRTRPVDMEQLLERIFRSNGIRVAFYDPNTGRIQRIQLMKATSADGKVRYYW